MNYTQISLLICGGVIAALGILMALDVSFFTRGLRRRYTEESVRAFCKKNVGGELLFAAGVILEAIQPEGISGLIAMVLCALGLAVSGMHMRVLKAK